MAGSYLDYGKLLDNGIEGLEKTVAKRKEAAKAQGEETELFEAMEMALQLLSRCCMYYYSEALGIAEAQEDAEKKAEWRRFQEPLAKCCASQSRGHCGRPCS